MLAPRVTTIEATTRAIVAYGRRSGRIPGISPGRRRPSDGRRAARGGLGTPPRSSFGARLRSRVPQYGHSVMYGDTSEPQLLQTTKRSGPLAMSPRHSTPPGATPGRIRTSLRRRRLDDLAHDLGVVPVRLVHDPLPVGAVPSLQEVHDALELGLRTEVLGVLAQPVDQAAVQLARRHRAPLGQLDELPVEPEAGGHPLVLVEHLVGEAGEPLAGLEVLGELLDHRLDE